MYGLILAATNSAKNAATGPDLVRFPAQNDVMTWAQTMGIGTCLLLIVVGAVYLLYGWQVYRPLITLNAAIIGGYIGVLVGQRHWKASWLHEYGYGYDYHAPYPGYGKY